MIKHEFSIGLHGAAGANELSAESQTEQDISFSDMRGPLAEVFASYRSDELDSIGDVCNQAGIEPRLFLSISEEGISEVKNMLDTIVVTPRADKKNLKEAGRRLALLLEQHQRD